MPEQRLSFNEFNERRLPLAAIFIFRDLTLNPRVPSSRFSYFLTKCVAFYFVPYKK